MKLSEKQKEVIMLMREGKTLTYYQPADMWHLFDINSHYNFSKSTFRSLEKAKIIFRLRESFMLTSLGKTIELTIKETVK